MAISLPDYFRLVKDLPHDHPVPNTRGKYNQWGFKKPHANGTIEIFKYVRYMYLMRNIWIGPLYRMLAAETFSGYLFCVFLSSYGTLAGCTL